MGRITTEGGLTYFGQEKVPYEGIEKMLGAVWENCTVNQGMDETKERVGRENLQRLLLDLRAA